MQIEEIEAKAIEVLAWGQTVFRPGQSVHARFEVALQALRKGGGLLPTFAKGSTLSSLVGMRARSRELAESEGACPGIVPEELLAAGKIADERISFLRSKVSFDDIDDILAGTWQDTDLGDEIRALREAMRVYVEASPSPAP